MTAFPVVAQSFLPAERWADDWWISVPPLPPPLVPMLLISSSRCCPCVACIRCCVSLPLFVWRSSCIVTIASGVPLLLRFVSFAALRFVSYRVEFTIATPITTVRTSTEKKGRTRNNLVCVPMSAFVTSCAAALYSCVSVSLALSLAMSLAAVSL